MNRAIFAANACPTATMLVVVGVIHLLPTAGMLGSERLATLYGIVIEDPNLEILLRHRAVLFGLLGSFLIYAAVRPALHSLALCSGLVSVVSFLGVAWLVGDFNTLIERVITADLIALGCLVIAAFDHYRRSRVI